MGRETEIIRLIDSILPRSKEQSNQLFEADAEIIDFNGSRLLVNIDEFSGEDLLRDEDPHTLGWNLAVGGLSDILAGGGRPLYYGHGLVVGKRWTDDYLRCFVKGVAAVLQRAGVSFIGGDLGFADDWRYSVTAIGSCDGNPLLHSKAAAGDQIFITGKIGTGNMEAFLKLASGNPVFNRLARPLKNRFHLRVAEAALIRKYSRACIDTSDGVFNALNTLAGQSKVGFEVGELPYDKTGELLAKLASIPRELLFLGECGEYELLFTVNPAVEAEFLQAARQAGLVFYNIGAITAMGKKVLFERGCQLDLANYNYSARDYDDIHDYLRDLIRFARG